MKELIESKWEEILSLLETEHFQYHDQYMDSFPQNI